MKLASARLCYRRPVAEDDLLLHALDNDAYVMRWINGGLPVSLARFRSELLPVYLELNEDITGFWVIESAEEFVGWISLRPTEREGEVSLGYRFRQAAWGKGYATEAVRAVLDSVARDPSLSRMVATTFEKNIGSQRVLEKSGFTLVRRFRLEDAHSDTSVQAGDPWDGDDLLYEISLTGR